MRVVQQVRGRNLTGISAGGWTERRWLEKYGENTIHESQWSGAVLVVI